MFEIIETSNNPFGNVLYEVNADSTSLNFSFFKLAVKQYEILDKKGLITEKNRLYLDPIRMKTDEWFIVWINNYSIDVSVVVKQQKLFITSARYRYEDGRNLLCQILSDGCLEHDYIVWQSFEKEVLDKLNIEYKKDWGYLLRNWYARWFFKNQLYIIGIAIILYVIYSQVQKKKKRKLDSPEFVE